MENKFKIGGVYKCASEDGVHEGWEIVITDIIDDRCYFRSVDDHSIEDDVPNFTIGGVFASHLTLVENPAEESKMDFVVGKRYRYKSPSESTFKSGVIEIVEEMDNGLHYRYYTVEGMNDDEGCFSADSSFARALEPIEGEYDPPMKKLKVKFWRLRNVVCMQVLEQDDRTRGNLDFSYCGVNLLSSAAPSILTENDWTYISEDDARTLSLDVYLRGTMESRDFDVTCVECENEGTAKCCIDRISGAIEAYNASLNPTVKTTEESDFEITIVGG